MAGATSAEYESLRRELAQIKGCITDYIRTVYSGSGLSFLAFAGIHVVKWPSDFAKDIVQVYTPLALSVLILTMLLILYYKFDSHNFHAGYCKLLSREKWDNDSYQRSLNGGLVIEVWEWCIDVLRQSFSVPNRLTDLLDGLDDTLKSREQTECGRIKEEIEHHGRRFKRDRHGRYQDKEGNHYRRVEASSNRGKVFSGGAILARSLMFREQVSTAWYFPVWVTTIFTIYNLIFLIIAYVFGTISIIENWHYITSVDLNGPIMEELTKEGRLRFAGVVTALLLGGIVQVVAWRFFLGYLHALILGNKTVDAYYYRFIPVRVQVLKAYGVTVEEV